MKNKNSMVVNQKTKNTVVEPAHPGVYLKDEITFCQIPENDIMKGLEISSDYLIGIISGENDISSDLSKKMGRLFGTTPGYWRALQESYDNYKK